MLGISRNGTLPRITTAKAANIHGDVVRQSKITA
jgi:hypothetical protein